MLRLPSTTFLISLYLLIMFCATSEGHVYGGDLKSSICRSTIRLVPPYAQAVLMGSEYDDKQEDVKFSMIGLPAYTMKDYDLQVELQRLQGNTTLPNVSVKQHRNDIESLMQAPELGMCWTADGSLSYINKAKIPHHMSQASDVLASLFCFHDVLDPVLMNNISNATQLDARDELVRICDEYGDLIIQESIYTEDSITTENIATTTECYARLPCFHCEQEVIEIRRGNKMVWNEVLQHADDTCAWKLKPIPAATVMECFKNGGRFIKSIQVPDRKIRCVDTRCIAPTEEPLMKVDSIGIRYGECEIEEEEKLTKFEALTREINQMMYESLMARMSDPFDL